MSAKAELQGVVVSDKIRPVGTRRRIAFELADARQVELVDERTEFLESSLFDRVEFRRGAGNRSNSRGFNDWSWLYDRSLDRCCFFNSRCDRGFFECHAVCLRGAVSYRGSGCVVSGRYRRCNIYLLVHIFKNFRQFLVICNA